MSYQIITDSCCDFTRQQYADLGLKYIPLTLIYKGAEQPGFTEPKELHAFYDSIRQGEMPTTSAANPQGWADLMAQSVKAGKDIPCPAGKVTSAEDSCGGYPPRRPGSGSASVQGL